MVRCPECGNEVSKPYSSWVIKPKSRNRRRVPMIRVSWFSCECGKRFKVAENIERKKYK